MSFTQQFDLEIQDKRDSGIEQRNEVVATSGTEIPISPSNGKPFQQAIIINQSIGPNENTFGTYLTVKVDGNTDITTIKRGGWACIDGVGTVLKIDSNTNGAKVEIIFTTSK